MILFAADASTRPRWNLTMEIVIIMDMEMSTARAWRAKAGTVKMKDQIHRQSSIVSIIGIIW